MDGRTDGRTAENDYARGFVNQRQLPNEAGTSLQLSFRCDVMGDASRILANVRLTKCTETITELCDAL